MCDTYLGGLGLDCQRVVGKAAPAGQAAAWNADSNSRLHRPWEPGAGQPLLAASEKVDSKPEGVFLEPAAPDGSTGQQAQDAAMGLQLGGLASPSEGGSGLTGPPSPPFSGGLWFFLVPFLMVFLLLC